MPEAGNGYLRPIGPIGPIRPMYLITGGSGFFGTHLTSHLLSLGKKVRILDIVAPPYFTEAEYVSGSVTDKEAVSRAMKGVEVVIHNAALVPLSRAGKKFWEVNVFGTRTVLDEAKKVGVRKFIYISSSAVYGVPSAGAITEETPLLPFDDYGASKAEAEALVQEAKKDLDASIIRPRTIIGTGRMGIVGLLFDWVARSSRVYILGNGENRFQLVSARDMAEAVIAASIRGPRGEDFNIGAEHFGALRRDLEEFIKKVGSASKVTSVSTALGRTILPLAEAMRLTPFVSYQYHIADKSVFFDISKAKKVLEWSPRDSNAELLVGAYNWYIKEGRRTSRSTPHGRPVKEGLIWLLRHLP